MEGKQSESFKASKCSDRADCERLQFCVNIVYNIVYKTILAFGRLEVLMKTKHPLKAFEDDAK